jgi:hypothetical protein
VIGLILVQGAPGVACMHVDYDPSVAAGDFSRLPTIVHPSYHYYGLIDLKGAQGVAGMQVR